MSVFDGRTARRAIKLQPQLGMSFDPDASTRFIRSIDNFISGNISEEQMWGDMSPRRSPQPLYIPVTV